MGQLSSRNVFVVGKGGVGKSTTAAALALGWAGVDETTHLISTDPAHSLADVFGLDPLGPALRDDVCGKPLVVEEFDARGYAEGWIGEITAPATRLFDLGTYLDQDDIHSFLALSLPGVDEVMASLRLTELQDGPATRIVVDTAPTGHLLRMLDSGTVLTSWVRALRAMARKATVVAEHLTRREVRLEAERFVDELEAGVRRFRDEVLGEARFVIVDRPGSVVAHETRHLTRSLEERGLRVGARIRIGGASDDTPDPDVVWVAPQRDLQGCEALARWGGDSQRGAGDGTGPGTSEPWRAPGRPGLPAPLSDVLSRRLILVAGKGGVGKSTCAAACAAAAAEHGPTVLVSTDPAGSLDALFQVEVTPGGEVEISSTLSLRQLDAEAEFERFRGRYRDEVEGIARGLGVEGDEGPDRDVMDSLLELAPPGIDEIFGLSVVMDVTEEDRTVVVDSAPTGHFLRLVGLPGAALEWTHALMRVLLKYRSVAGLDRTAERLLDFSRRLKALQALLTDSARAATLLVTLDEPVVEAESRDLLRILRGSGLPVGAWIENRARGSSGTGAGGGEADGAPPVLVAPELEEPPVGLEALRAFLGRWTAAQVPA